MCTLCLIVHLIFYRTLGVLKITLLKTAYLPLVSFFQKNVSVQSSAKINSFLHNHSLRLCLPSDRFSSFFLSTFLKFIDMPRPILTRLKVMQGSLGSKILFSLTSFQVQQIMQHDHVTYVYDRARTLYKDYFIRNSSGVNWCHSCQKVIFSKNAVTHPWNIARP